MEFPSLLYTAGPSGHTIPEDVFEDVKLRLFFSDEAVAAMRPACVAADIPVRQAFFRAFLEDPAVLPRFRAMSQVVDQIWTLADGVYDARCDVERDFTFVNLISQVVRFVTMAAQPPLRSSALWDRFAAAFAALAGTPAFQAVETSCAQVLALAQAVRQSCYVIRDDNLALRQESAPSFTDSLLDCARELGFDDVEGARTTSVRLSAAVLNAQAQLYPEAFAAMADFYRQYRSFYDDRILDYRAEMNFYIEAAGLMQRLKDAGVPTVWPKVSQARRLYIKNARDISLVTKNEVEIVPNDVDFTEAEPFWFLTGANGGGKTTYLRCVGINVLLFLSGCPVAGEEAQLWPVTNVFTHFPRDERSDSEGRLSEEQQRVDEILAAHGGSALVLLNETYSAANAEQAPQFTIDLAEQLADTGSFGLYITHQHAMKDTKIPFLSVAVDQQSANRRTFRIERCRGAAWSFASDILRKYNMDRNSLMARFSGKGASL